ncbi:MAG: hypothetical protein LBG27_04615 [Spirochaetaceae bacterium]|nr:hypothetical protein [Spirochaetaceae bacterium]
MTAGGHLILENGAAIKDNTSTVSYTGAGVSMSGGATFTMTGGEISGNTATHGGGGVVIYDYSVFTMSGGEISGNTAVGLGGGVSIGRNAGFTMNGGEIRDNTATDTGPFPIPGSRHAASVYGCGLTDDFCGFSQEFHRKP